MLRSLNSGVSGVQQFQQRLDVIGNNIANSNTIGYKAARADFADTFSQTLRAPIPGVAPAGSSPAMQIGLGVQVSGIKNNYSQGALTTTGRPEDLAIAGDGFFIVRDAISNAEFATRAGDFMVDDQGYLTTNNGLRVQGFSDAGLTTRGDIQIDDTGKPGTTDPLAIVSGFNVAADGRVLVQMSDGTQFTRGQVLLQRFTNPQALIKEGGSLYSGIGLAGPLGGATPQTEPPNTNGLGSIAARALELSNVDLTTEFTNLITTQRGFQASARVITTSDEVLQEVVNLKR